MTIPLLIAAASSEILFDLFLDLLKPLGETCDVVLESSHDSRLDCRHIDFRRQRIDAPTLTSHCCDSEDLLCNDGCTGLAVLSALKPMEVQFDDHKLLVVYAADMEPFQRILEAYGIRQDDSLKLVSEGEHLHSSDPRFRAEFNQLACRLEVEQKVLIS